MSVITTHRDGEVLVVVSDNPPVNALGAAVRRGLAAALQEAAGDPSVKAVVIRGEGRTFFAGADITEFGKPPAGSGLPEVIDVIEGSAKPVVAAIHGTALGGGLEVAMGCHYRVAVPSAKLGLPEVKLGILPGAGGTQRLPRLIGVEAALQMIVSGDPISASKAHTLGLIDRLTAEDRLEADAVAFAREIAAQAPPVTRARTDKLDGATSEPFERFRRDNARRLKGFEAPELCIQAVQAAVEQPFEAGVARERALFERLVIGAQSKALRHNFFAERAAAKVDGVAADTPLLPIRKVGVLGAGTMGGGIAMNFLSAGIAVTMVEREQGPLDRGVALMRKNYENTAKRGRLTAEQVEAAMGLLTPSLAYEDLADCDLVIEAVFEEMAVKKEVFRRLDAIVRPGAILASNTSYLDVDEIAAETKRPEWVIGLHFFSPANVMRLLEVVRGAKTSPQVLATCMGLAKRIGKAAVVARVCYGFIGNRMLAIRKNESERLILQGAPYWRVDQVLLDFGFPMGPFQMGDLAGLDIGWNRETSKSATIREALCERDRRGQKAGKGFYDYDEARNRTPSKEVEEIIAGFAARSGLPQRDISDQEILERLLFPMVNEGALILEEKIAQRASDIDVVWLNGYGWPAWTGGPMFWADAIGLDKVVASLERLQPHMDPAFRMSALLRDKAARGERFEA
jgi:3-hydroxyacyl-CoA dehydrogenase